MNFNKDWYDDVVTENKIIDIPYEQIGKERIRIGFGRYGIVYKTTCNLIEGDVAIKETYIRSDSNQEYIEIFINEARIHNLTRNKRIIQFYGISRNVKERLYYIVMEYANDGTLRDFLGKKNSMDLKERIRLATQISEGLSYLHNRLNISHRDLHAKNILVKNGNIKISDFGMSKSFNPPFALDKISDIYSLGAILLELSNYRKPLHKERFICLKKDRLEKNERSKKTLNLEKLQLKPLEPVYLNTTKKEQTISS